jgi:hypothetical protein
VPVHPTHLGEMVLVKTNALGKVLNLLIGLFLSLILNFSLMRAGLTLRAWLFQLLCPTSLCGCMGLTKSKERDIYLGTRDAATETLPGMSSSLFLAQDVDENLRRL